MDTSIRTNKIKPSPTLAVTAKAAELKAAGHDIISLGAGEPDFDTPDHIKQAAITAIKEGFTKYTPVDGLPELKDAIINKLQNDNNLTYNKEQILVSSGAKHSLFNLCQALLNPGDEAIIPCPYWVSYPDMVLLADAIPVFIKTGIDNRFKITAQQLKDTITPKTKLIFLNKIQQQIKYNEDLIQSLSQTVAGNKSQLAEFKQQRQDDILLNDSLLQQKNELQPEITKINESFILCDSEFKEIKQQFNVNDESIINNQELFVKEKSAVESLQNNINYSDILLTKSLAEKSKFEKEKEKEIINEAQLEQELAGLREGKFITQQNLDTAESSADDLCEQLNKEQQKQDDLREQISLIKGNLQNVEGKLSLLNNLQEKSLNTTFKNKLLLSKTGVSLDNLVIENLDIDEAWAKAFEVVLGSLLKGFVVDDLKFLIKHEDKFLESPLSILTKRESPQNLEYKTKDNLLKLTDCIRSKLSLPYVIESVYCANTLQQAQDLLERIPDNCSVITPNGHWLGHGWVQIPDHKTEFGLIQRNKEIKDLNERKINLLNNLKQTERSFNLIKVQCQEMTVAVDNARKKIFSTQEEQRIIINKIEIYYEKIKVLQEKVKSFEEKIDENIQLIKEQKQSQLKYREKLQVAINSLDETNQDAIVLRKNKNAIQESLDESRLKVMNYKERRVVLEEQMKSVNLQLDNVARLKHRTLNTINNLQSGIESSLQKIQELEQPMVKYKEDLQAYLSLQTEEEAILGIINNEIEELASDIKAKETISFGQEKNINELQKQQQNNLLDIKEIEVQKKALDEKFVSLDICPITKYEKLPQEYTVAFLKEELIKLNDSIVRLGQINMAAIDECAEEEKRKEYIEQQDTDLMQALTILEQAISKIDKETKSIFKATFDAVNGNLMQLFPKVFAGGKAYLQLTDDDLLTAGVQVIAKPPGKKNVLLNMLSGGEKALTAIALVFAIFKLNPAPFCLLDEVDAPLDDVNVTRFAELVKEMAETVQFIFITHNKITMEIAEHLLGVTMKESGVSKLVSVNINEAEELVA